MTERPTLAVGLMSGTSLDGMDAALVRFDGPTRADLLAFTTLAYGSDDRHALEQAPSHSNAPALAHLHARLGSLAVGATQSVLDRGRISSSELDFIAFPGHTIWHEPPTVTWQLGDSSVLAEAFGVRVVHDFRARDVAAGGEGAPLVPMADILLYGHPEHPRGLLNIGGMANVTVVPSRLSEDGAMAFDTGPGMVLIDALARAVDPALPFDIDATVSARGTTDTATLEYLLAHEFFERPPPKSTGREQFGAALAKDIATRVPGPDGVSTAVSFTVESIARAMERWLPESVHEIIVSGGGRHHPGVFDGLSQRLAGGGRMVRRFDDVFYDGDAKEAVAFALLGYLTVHGQPGNLPAATGARGARVLGTVTPP